MAEKVVGSNMPSNTGYGRASYLGPASDLPGQNTKADFVAHRPSAPVNDQLRSLPSNPLPTTFGLRSRKGE